VSGPGRHGRGEPAKGFVLVGVVMMVIALTIIGLSLISLSGYETQFYSHSLFDRQSLYSAGGGLELVKQLVLSDQGSGGPKLSNAGLAVGREEIVSALAWQENPADSSGPVDWSRDVHIRVGVSVHGVVRTIEGTFTETIPDSPYHDLLTVPGLLIAIAPSDSQNCADPLEEGAGRAPLVLDGTVWQNIPPADSAWKIPGCFSFLSGSAFRILPARAPVPLASKFISDHLASAIPPTMTIGTGANPINEIVLAGSSSGTFFTSPASDPTTTDPVYLSSFDFVSWNRLRVRVSGTAIWLVPAGMHLENKLLIERTGESRPNLIIVAGPSGRYPGGPDIGLDLIHGISIDPTLDVNVFLVTDGTLVDSDRDDNITDYDEASRLSIFAQNYSVLPGGLFPGQTRTKVRRYGGPSMQNASDDLLDHGLLPRPSGGSATGLTLVAGTWTTSPGLQ